MQQVDYSLESGLHVVWKFVVVGMRLRKLQKCRYCKSIAFLLQALQNELALGVP